MSAKPSPILRRRRLGSELRRLREAAELTIQEVAEHLDCSGSKVSRIETARVGATVRDIRDMLELYDVSSEQRQALLQLAQEARQQKAWWQAYTDLPDLMTYIGLEDAAVSIRAYEALLVPGLLQCQEYARTIIATMRPKLHPAEVERRVEVRMARWSRLSGDGARLLSVVIDEAVLHRMAGEQWIMREQLRHLSEAAALPNVTLQVLPFEAGQYVGMSGAFTILSFPEPTDPDIVYLEQTGGGLYLESPEEVLEHSLRFDELRAVALRPDDSTAFVTTMLEAL